MKIRWTHSINTVKVGLAIVAILITIISLWVSRELIKDLEHEEHTRMEVWAEAMRAMGRADETTDLTLVLKVLEENGSIPVVVLDANGTVLEKRNLEDMDLSGENLQVEIEAMKQSGRSIRILLTDNPEDVAVKNKEYTYAVKDNYIIVSIPSRTKITKSYFERALELNVSKPSEINLRGHSYIYGIITDSRIK